MNNDLENLCIHTMTNKPWSIEECLTNYGRAGIGGVSIWRNVVEGKNLKEVSRMVRSEGLSLVSYVRGGFFPAVDVSERQKAIDENFKIIDEAYELGAPLIVLVCGAVPGQPLEISRGQILDGIATCLDHASEAGVKLGIEPLHPMYSDDRSAINSLGLANTMAIQLDHDAIGVTLDAYHTWWDPQLEKEIMRSGLHNKLFSYHICDWKTPTLDLLNDRGLMGEGCIDLKGIAAVVEKSGFHGFHEVEIFSNRYWESDQNQFLDKIISAWRKLNVSEETEE